MKSDALIAPFCLRCRQYRQLVLLSITEVPPVHNHILERRKVGYRVHTWRILRGFCDNVLNVGCYRTPGETVVVGVKLTTIRKRDNIYSFILVAWTVCEANKVDLVLLKARAYQGAGWRFVTDYGNHRAVERYGGTVLYGAIQNVSVGCCVGLNPVD